MTDFCSHILLRFSLVVLWSIKKEDASARCVSLQVSWKGSDDKDFNQTIVHEEIQKVLDSHDMRGNQSVFFFNVGIHYSLPLNFTAYQMLIDSIIKILRRDTDTENEGALKSRALFIWRSNAAVEAKGFEDFFSQVNYTEWRFYTNQVIIQVEILNAFIANVIKSFADRWKDVFVSARVKQMY